MDQLKMGLQTTVIYKKSLNNMSALFIVSIVEWNLVGQVKVLPLLLLTPVFEGFRCLIFRRFHFGELRKILCQLRQIYLLVHVRLCWDRGLNLHNRLLLFWLLFGRRGDGYVLDEGGEGLLVDVVRVEGRWELRFEVEGRLFLFLESADVVLSLFILDPQFLQKFLLFFLILLPLPHKQLQLLLEGLELQI